MSTALEERVEEQRTDEPPIVSHIVYPKSKITEAYINGTPVEALCGYVWVPSRDPKQHPVCDKCLEVWNQMGREEGTWSQ